MKNEIKTIKKSQYLTLVDFWHLINITQRNVVGFGTHDLALDILT